MKKKMPAAVFILFFAVICLFSSCEKESFIRTVDSLITPPLFYMEYEGLVDAFNEYVGNNPVLCNPSDGEYNSAITVKDLDGDSVEEALVLYKDPVSDTGASLCLMKNVDNNWKVLGKFSGYGNEVAKIDLSDLDGDGISEIMVTWNYSGITGANVFSLYRSTSDLAYKEIATESCGVVEQLDLDGDGNNEIFYISSSGETASISKNAKVLKITDGKPVLMGETKVDPNTGYYVSLLLEKQTGGKAMKIYVDATKSDNQMITEVLYWDGEASTLINPLYDEENSAANSTLRFEQIVCRDINDDGLIEIPVQTVYYENDGSTIYETDWKNYSGGNMTTVKRTIVNNDDLYMVDLSCFGATRIGLRKYENQNCWIVYIDDGMNKTGNELFSVLRVSQNRWNTEDFESYVPIRINTDGVVCVFVTDKGKQYGFDDELLKEAVINLA